MRFTREATYVYSVEGSDQRGYAVVGKYDPFPYVIFLTCPGSARDAKALVEAEAWLLSHETISCRIIPVSVGPDGITILEGDDD